MTDQREKRIQEIRRSYELVKQVVPMRVPNTHMPMLEEEVDFLFEEISRLKADKQKLHNVYEAQYSRACQLQQEIEQCNEEYQSHMSGMQQEIERLQRDIAFLTNPVPTTGTEILIRERIQEEAKRIERLQVERDKAIEGLRWYAQADYGQYCDFLDPRNEAHADKAFYILSELGVPHDPLD